MRDVTDINQVRKQKKKVHNQVKKQKKKARRQKLMSLLKERFSQTPENVILAFEDEAENYGPETITKFDSYFERLTQAVNVHKYPRPLQQYVIFLDSVGDEYIHADKNARNTCLEQMLNLLSEFPDDLITELMFNIDEPWIIMDYLVNEPQVTPQTTEIINYVKNHVGGIYFADSRDDFSRFWLADAVLKYGNFPSKRNLDLEPEFLDRTLDGIAGICHGKAFLEGYERINRYPEDIQEQIEDRIEHNRFIELF